MKHPLDTAGLYLAWQAPFVKQKMAPLVRRHPGLPFRRVLDVGCGPGVNAGAFAHTEYLGVDLDPGYVATARARHGDRFMEGDAGDLQLSDAQPFDCILINSLLHHLDDAQVRSLLQSALKVLSPDGTIYVMDLHLPDGTSLPRALALADRGKFARPLRRLRALLAEQCTIQVEEEFTLHLGPLTMWRMVYFELDRGRRCA
jgi:SAM-dependent methyltransferase